ncbi:MAG: 50S ribosomal protein L29 [bacterium]|nr:50S ribosomal protein L29 [bacterium]
MKVSELRQKSDVDLKELLKERRSRLEELHFLLSQGKVKQVHEVGEIKKDIARILTLLKNPPQIHK